MATLMLTEFLLARIAEDEQDSWVMPEGGGRMRDECEAKRRIVALHTPDHECTDGSESYPGVFGAGMLDEECPTLLALALPYAEHPDFNPAWRE